MIDDADAVGHEGGDDDHEREERDERLPGERHAAIDELDLEHPFPHPPEEQAFRPFPQRDDALDHVGDARADRQIGSISPGRPVRRVRPNHVPVAVARPRVERARAPIVKETSGRHPLIVPP